MNLIQKSFGYAIALAILLLTAVEAKAQTSFTSGIDYASSTTATLWFKPTSTVDWTDAHYNTGTGQQNIRMSYNASNARYEQLISATAGTNVSYSFTYSMSSLAYDTTQMNATVPNGPSSSSSSSSSVITSSSSSIASSSSSSTTGLTYGVDDAGSSITIWLKPNSQTVSWSNVHFNINSTGQQNLTMNYNSTTARYETVVSTTAGTALSVSYSFTYALPSGAVDSPAYSYNRIIGSSSSSVSSSVASSSLSSSVVSSSSSSSANLTWGVTDNGSNLVVWLQPNGQTVSWANIHFNLNSTGQQNMTMSYNSGTARYEQSIATTAGAAESLSYSFTYALSTGAVDSATYSFTRIASSSSSATSSSIASSSSSVNSSVSSSVVSSSVSSSSSSIAGNFIQGVSDLGSTSTIWFKASYPQQYVILHVSIGTGSQNNPQMTYNSTLGRWEAVVSPVSTGVNIHYNFTYQTAAGNLDSDWFDHTVGYCPTCPASPSFSPLGGSFASSPSVTLSTSVSGGVIRYTTDGRAPNSTSPVYNGTPIFVASAATINAIVVDPTGLESQLASQTYVVSQQTGTLTAPSFSLPSGTYNTIIRVSLSNPIPGAYIHYTTDGSLPTASSPVYSTPIEVKIDTTKNPVVNTTQIRAIAVKEGWTTSAETSQTYTITNNVTSASSWNGMTTFKLVNGTKGKYADNQVYWSIIGKDWNTGKFVHVDLNGNLIPMSLSDNGQLMKNGMPYANYFYTLAQVNQITIPAINSARLLMSVGSPMYIWVNQDVNGNIGYAGANVENPTDPNIDVTFDFGEFAIIGKDQPYQGLFINTTRVDLFGFPVQLSVTGLDGFSQTVGEPLTETRDELFARFINETPTEFHNLAQAPYSPYRIMAPAHASFQTGGNNATYLDDYISSVWEQYRHQSLTLNLNNGWPTFTGNVVGDTFVFTDGQGTYQINGKPTTSMAMLGNGYLDDASGVTGLVRDKQLQLQAQVCAALNRHVAHLAGNQWYNSANFFPAGQASNFFTKFWHDHALNGLTYGFSYDDVGGYSPSIYTPAPQTVTFTIGQ